MEIKTYRYKAKSMALARMIRPTPISQPTSDGLADGNASKAYITYFIV